MTEAEKRRMEKAVSLKLAHLAPSAKSLVTLPKLAGSKMEQRGTPKMENLKVEKAAMAATSSKVLATTVEKRGTKQLSAGPRRKQSGA